MGKPIDGMDGPQVPWGDRMAMMGPRMCVIRRRFPWMGEPIDGMGPASTVMG